MSKWLWVIFVASLIHQSSLQGHSKFPDEEDSSSNFPKNDFLRFFNDIWKNIGLEKPLKRIGSYIKAAVREGQTYTARDFERDFEKVKAEPTFWNIIQFIQKVTWPSIVQACIQLINFISQLQVFLLAFLKKKCDIYLGKDATLHPFNLLKEQGQQQISIIVSVYAFLLSLIVIKLLSWWNFLMYLSFGVIIYYVGGPYLVFKCLLTVTAFFAFVIQMFVSHPLQIAIIIIVFYLLNVARSMFRNDERMVRENVTDRREYKTLVERLDGVERKTNLLNSKLDKLSRSMERLVPSDSEVEQ